ncbi:hypothetical protein BGW38_009368, partial [Lunasporangiospora selenospora]
SHVHSSSSIHTSSSSRPTGHDETQVIPGGRRRTSSQPNLLSLRFNHDSDSEDERNNGTNKGSTGAGVTSRSRKENDSLDHGLDHDHDGEEDQNDSDRTEGETTPAFFEAATRPKHSKRQTHM